MRLFNKEKEKFKPFVIYCNPIEYNGIMVWYMNNPENQYGGLCYNNDDLCLMITWPLFPPSKTVLSFENDAESIITDDPAAKLKLIQLGTYTGEFTKTIYKDAFIGVNTHEEKHVETIPILAVIKSDDDYAKIDSLDLCKRMFGEENIEYKKFE